jgi:hypothetical protein
MASVETSGGEMKRSAAAMMFTLLAGCGQPDDKVWAFDCSDALCANAHNGDTRWYCDGTQSPPTCSDHVRACASAADCCPSQVCNSAGTCGDTFTACEIRDGGAGSCTVAGQICATIGVRPSGLGCTFAKCSAAGTCAAPAATCFNFYCVGAVPCGGGCPSGQVCGVASNACSPAPRDSTGTCQRSCGSGLMLVLHDPNNIFDTCSLLTETCDCAIKPD